MGHFIQSGDTFHPAPSKDSLLDGLPVGNYEVEENMQGIFFKRVENFAPLGRLYGETERWADRIHSTFQDRAANTGVLLEGEKGSGKSLLGRLIALKGAELGMPTVMVPTAIPGDRLGGLLNQLSQPAIVFLDEFEKTYQNLQVQESVLSLLDGTGASKHLYVLTVNDAYRLSSFLKNRPGRLYYAIQFAGLDQDFVREYCEDNLENKSHMEEVVRMTSVFDILNFDMLKALLEEMNRYGESPTEAVKLLNITPADNNSSYTVEVKGEGGKVFEVSDDTWYGNPLLLDGKDFYVSDENAENTDEDGDVAVYLTAHDLTSFEAATGKYQFKKDGYTFTMTNDRLRMKPLHWSQAL